MNTQVGDKVYAITVGENVQRIRRRKRLTQLDLSKRTGKVMPWISKVERGHVLPSVENLVALAIGLGTTVKSLVTWDEVDVEVEEIPS